MPLKRVVFLFLLGFLGASSAGATLFTHAYARSGCEGVVVEQTGTSFARAVLPPPTQDPDHPNWLWCYVADATAEATYGSVEVATPMNCPLIGCGISAEARFSDILTVFAAGRSLIAQFTFDMAATALESPETDDFVDFSVDVGGVQIFRAAFRDTTYMPGPAPPTVTSRVAVETRVPFEFAARVSSEAADEHSFGAGRLALRRIEFFDEDGRGVRAQVTSLSGTEYPVLNSVPEPSTFTAVTSGLWLLTQAGARVRRRCCR